MLYKPGPPLITEETLMPKGLIVVCESNEELQIKLTIKKLLFTGRWDIACTMHQNSLGYQTNNSKVDLLALNVHA